MLCYACMQAEWLRLLLATDYGFPPRRTHGHLRGQRGCYLHGTRTV
jgi:hypothetical protein